MRTIITTIICLWASLNYALGQETTLSVLYHSQTPIRLAGKDSVLLDTMELVANPTHSVWTTWQRETELQALQELNDILLKGKINSVVYVYHIDQLISLAEKEGPYEEKFLRPLFTRKDTRRLYKTLASDTLQLVVDLKGKIEGLHPYTLPPVEWQILDDTTTIAGYHCQKARCSWQGRQWTAWYSEEIPLSNGPAHWQGLPGLIMSIEDEQGLWRYQLAGITQTERPRRSPIMSVDKRPILSTKEYNDHMNKIRRERLVYYPLQSNTMVFCSLDLQEEEIPLAKSVDSEAPAGKTD